MQEEVLAQIREVTAFNREIVRQNTLLQQELAAMRQAQAQPPAAPVPAAPVEPEDPTTLAIRERMFQVMPWLKDLQELAGKKADLLGAASSVPQVIADREAAIEAENRFWENYREQQFTTLSDQIAAAMLGDGKTAKDLPPIVRTGAEASYQRWVLSDPTRAARYERQDQTLLGEFFAEYRAHHIAPARRQELVATLDAAAGAPPMPRGGPSVQPGPAATPPPALPKDEDALMTESWNRFQQRAS